MSVFDARVSFDDLVINYQNRNSIYNGRMVMSALLELTESVLENIITDKEFGEILSAQDLAAHAMTQIHQFDPDKGAAFNYFTTIILNHYRGEYGRIKTRRDLLEIYKNILPKPAA